MIDFPHKIRIPQLPDQLVPRERLRTALSAVLTKRLVTVTAPAGYGKTSLLIDFASNAPLPVCWYTLDQFDDDPWTFVGYLAAAVREQFPAAMAQTHSLLAAAGPVSFDLVMAACTRDMYSVGSTFALIIDDWHLVDTNDDISAVVAHLLTRCPNCHIILASRSYPSLPDLMLLTARQQMHVLDDNGLRFTPPEVAAVLQTTYQLPPDLERAAAFVEQTNGWITGILLSVQADTALQFDAGAARHGAERHVYRFLAEQVFERQPELLRRFLLDSALLEDMTAEQCDRVFERTDSRLMLHQLLQQRLFISEINPHVFRYHPLLREFLREHYRTVDGARYHTTALRVAAMHLQQAQWIQAFALCLSVGDSGAAQQVVAAGGDHLYTSGRLDTLDAWFAALPMDDLTAPLLCLKARVALNRRQHHEAQVLADLAQVRMRPDERPVVLLLQALLARVLGRYEQSLEIGSQVLACSADPAQRATALRTMALCYLRLGQLTAAVDAAQQALALERARGDIYGIASVSFDLGLCYEAAGRIQEAEEYYSQADAGWATCGNSGQRALSLNSKGVVQHLAGRYRDAHATLSEALHYSRQSAVRDYQATVLTSIGDLYCDLQCWPQAADSFAAARATGGGSAFLRGYLELAEIRLLARQRHYLAAAAALQRLPETVRSRFAIAVALLQTTVACGLSRYEPAASHLQKAADLLRTSESLVEQGLACLLQAQIAAATKPNDSAALLEPLRQIDQIVARLGHDAFLVAETYATASVVRRAQAAGWPPATDWLRRHQQLRHIARQIIQADDQRPILMVRALGADQIALDDQPLAMGWAKAREVLYYLLATPTGVTVEALCETIWPDRELEQGRELLKTAIYRLRGALPRDSIQLHRRQVFSLNRDVMHLDYDVDRFLSLVDGSNDDIETLDEALTLYAGPYLEWCDSSWCVGQRTYLEERLLRALQATALRYEHVRRYDDALGLYRRIVALNPLHEAAHAGVMRCQFALGNRAGAIHQYRELCRLLDTELGLDPTPTSEAAQLFRTILHADHAPA